MNDYDDEIPSDVREELNADRQRRANARHWCDECHGHTGPGSPCAPDQPATEEDDQP